MTTRICDILDYKTDIEPFPFVKLYSGVGSGKSYFATRMITGSDEHKIPEHNVLIITSRRSKVEETLKEMKGLVKRKISKDGNLSYDIWESSEIEPDAYKKYLKEIKINVPDFGDITFSQYNQSAVCTNAFVSAYLRYVHETDNPMTHIWNKFDAIIIDEVHSLVTDATYQASTFDVLALIREYLNLAKNNQLQDCACKHLILMTGTPEPFDAFVKTDFPEELTHTMKLFDKCENIVPKNVTLIDEQTSKIKIKELLSSGEKVIYFTNHTLHESAVRTKFALDMSVNIGVSFTKEEKRRSLIKEEREKIERIDSSLAEHNLIPEDIQFFVTTSRNKEGININNDDYNYMFVETHQMYDVVQMSGRVRKGVDTLYIISNAEPLTNSNYITDIKFSKKVLVENDDITDSENEVNKYLISEYLQNDLELQKPKEDRNYNIMKYVKYIEDRFSYIKYNVFNQLFEFFNIKENAEKMTVTQEDAFKQMVISGDNEYIEHWFPNSAISRELSVKEYAVSYLKKLIGTREYVKIGVAEFENHLSAIKKMLDLELTSSNSILHVIDKNFNCKKIRNYYIFYYGKEYPNIKRKPMGRRLKR